MQFIESLSLKLDLPPLHAILRTVLGLILVPGYSLVSRADSPSWLVLVYFLLILAALRVGPLVLRKLLPFSTDALSVWAARRQLAKFYDSYQWRKLFWIGLGLALYLLFVRLPDKYWISLAGICLVGGGIGLITWHVISRSIAAASKPAV